MKQPKDGGPAFPLGEYVVINGVTVTQPTNGMTLRDYFATAALQGIFSSWGECEGWEHNVKWAYIYADGMLAERDKRGGQS